MWTDNYQKAVTFSYDDGVVQDRRLVELLNRYHLKATFNINTQLQPAKDTFWIENTHVDHLSIDEMISLYRGHEVASHSQTHPDLTKLTDQALIEEIRGDANTIQLRFDKQPFGFVYPFGTYNDSVVDYLKRAGFRYARTVESNYRFDLQTDLLRFQPTCHHNDPKLSNLIDEFLVSQPTKPMILYIWGHSYEFDVDNNWDHIESIFKRLANRPELYYGTNEDVLLIEGK